MASYWTVMVYGVAGIASALGFGFALLALDVAGLGMLAAMSSEPGARCIVVAGAAVAIAPALFVALIGLLSAAQDNDGGGSRVFGRGTCLACPRLSSSGIGT